MSPPLPPVPDIIITGIPVPKLPPPRKPILRGIELLPPVDPIVLGIELLPPVGPEVISQPSSPGIGVDITRRTVGYLVEDGEVVGRVLSDAARDTGEQDRGGGVGSSTEIETKQKSW